jgi:periplasmic protein TonB
MYNILCYSRYRAGGSQTEDPPLEDDPIPDWTTFEPPPVPTGRPAPPGDNYTPVTSYAPAPPQAGPTGFNVVPDGPLVVLLRVEPRYPMEALLRRLEGTVLVESDVAANGTVSQARVVESSGRVFENAALAAAKRFRYKPRVVDGVAVPVSGVRYQFRFELSD